MIQLALLHFALYTLVCTVHGWMGGRVARFEAMASTPFGGGHHNVRTNQAMSKTIDYGKHANQPASRAENDK